MRCFAKYALLMLIALGGAVIAPRLNQVAAAGEDPAALQADREFVRAAAKGDQEAVGKLLDAEFTWTDSQGKTYTKGEALTELPQLAVRGDVGANAEHRTYGPVVAGMGEAGRADACGVGGSGR